MQSDSWMFFVQQLAVLLSVAACVNIILGRFRVPIFIGYLLAGVLASSGLGFFNSLLNNSDNLKLWSEIGIIFLLFTIGLEFSVGDFFRLGSAPIKTGIFETVGTFLAISLVLKSMGQDWGSSLSIASCFTISSTAIITKSFQENHLNGVRFVKHILGVLVFEDIVVIIILLLLPTLTVSQLFSGVVLLEKILLILSFLFFSIFLGFLALPKLSPLLMRLNSEGLLVFSAGLALITASASHGAGLSFGIGAFISGSILAQLPKRESILHSIEPIRNLFMAIFFVATGMLLKLDGFRHAILPAIGLSVLVILAKLLIVSIGSLLSGESFRNSVKSGLTMSAMGEFTLLTAQVSLSLNLLSARNFQIVVITTFLNILFFTFTFKYHMSLANKLERYLPQKFISALDSYRQPSSSEHLSSIELFKKFYLATFCWNTLAIATIAFVTHKGLITLHPNQIYKTLIILLSLVVTLPFFWGLIFFQPSLKSSELNRFADRLKRYQGVFLLFRALMAAILFLIVGNLIIGWVTSLILFVIVLTVLHIMKREIGYAHKVLSRLFLKNLTLNDQLSPHNQLLETFRKNFWEAQISELSISPNSALVGMSLMDAQIREQYNVLIIAIDRGKQRIYGPSRFERLYPGDRLFAVGNEEDILRFRPIVEVTDQDAKSSDLNEPFALESFDIPENSLLIGQTIRESPLRNQGGSLIIAIERGNSRILYPSGDMILCAGDRVWLAGEQAELNEKIHMLERAVTH